MSATPNATSKRTHEDLDALSETGSQTKKPRHEEKAAGLCRDDEFWEEDGNIVLVAGNVEFRVYRGVLAHHSPVFADMFSLPQPVGDVSTAPGSATSCPVVQLADSPEDLRHVLRAILPRKHARLVHDEAEDLSFHAISAYARLGHKFQIVSLLEQSTEFLMKTYGDKFDRWHENRQPGPPKWQDEYAIGVVNIARLIGCPFILPGALALCCTLRPKQLLHGFKREDGSEEKLDESDLLRCLNGRSELINEGAFTTVLAISSFRHPACCRHSKECRKQLRLLLFAEKEYMSIPSSSYPFKISAEDLMSWQDLCEYCMNALSEKIAEQKVATWRRLPTTLDIEGVDGWGQNAGQVRPMSFVNL
ncbi:hypothetical protein C8Q80DRAFT_1357930 [Daedaleopsis nitida]|nr:hypothetical protein C8Q80DRAFT_1357930 [Daedaleopsis nitida]